MYSSCYPEERKLQWQTIDEMGEHMDLTWVVIGDLNVTMSFYERHSFTTHTYYTPALIQDTIQKYGLQDVPFTGHPFTWSNKRSTTHLVQTRLDRALATTQWLSFFPDAFVQHLIPLGSNHAPILLTTAPSTIKPHKPFRLYETWTKHATFKHLIQREWSKEQVGSMAMKFTKKLQQVRRGISKWRKQYFGDIDEHIKSLQQQIREAQQHPATLSSKLPNLQQELQHWYTFKADISRQKSRDKVLQDQDRNTKVFHAQANYRRRRNQIDSIRDEQGNWYTSRQDIQKLLIHHFSSITTT
ncbi:hypothetical protein MKX03_008395 [Papaver bracteatum]|nr:hypothetical protein MKX03_008395 [Papaver bracteatum]